MNVESLKNELKVGESIGIKELNSEIGDVVKFVESHGNKPQIINSGLLKAGKSSLFNAIAGKEEFDTGVVRATVVNKSVELDKYILVDTPGLDANNSDTKVAFDGYKNADIIVFVHNVIDGELNKIEVEAINVLTNMFDDFREFLHSSVLVLSHADQLEGAELDKLTSMINEQCKKIFKSEFGYVVAVNSTGYIKGISEGKSLLVESSNINTLKELLNKLVIEDGQASYFNAYVKKSIDRINKKITVEIDKKEKQKNEISNLINDTDKLISAKNQISKKINDSITKLKNENTIPSGISKVYFSSDKRSYKDYKSEYQAKSAAKEACKAAIRSAAAVARTKALNIVAKYESYIAPDGKINALKNELFNIYNEIKETYYNVVKNSTSFPVFDIKFRSDSATDRLKKDIKDSYEYSKYIAVETFSSADYYLTRYSSNMYIDYDYRTEYVSGLFGSREKEVKYYNWEIEGAIDDIGDEARDIIEHRTELARESSIELYRYYVDDLTNQFQVLTGSFSKQIDAQIALSESNNKKILKEKEDLDRVIMGLNQFKQALERI